MTIIDIIYFVSSIFMTTILFFGIDENFALIVAFMIVALWFKLKKIVD